MDEDTKHKVSSFLYAILSCVALFMISVLWHGRRVIIKWLCYCKSWWATKKPTLCQYKKELTFSTECSVCLIAFREGEEVKLLPSCRHSFHTMCFDMWLKFHLNCPSCRAPVHLAAFERPAKLEDSRARQLEATERALVQ